MGPPAMRESHRGGRTLLVTLAALAAGSCFLPIPRAMRPPEGVISDSLAAEAARQDSVARAAARRDSILAAEREATRQESIARAEREAARRDSIARAEQAEAARRDSILAAEREAARRDSLEAARRDSIASIEAARAAAAAELAQLRESGPVYVPYDEPPRLVWDTEAEAALATTLLPVIRGEGLDPNIATSVWLLVRTDGRVEATAIQTTSGDGAFDAAAVRAARGLLFAPALRGGRVAPVWVLREISLLMR